MAPVARAAAWWVALGALTWVTVFEWQARTAGERFAFAQVARHERGQALETLSEGNRRLQPQAARDATVVTTPLLAVGLAATWAASRRGRASKR